MRKEARMRIHASAYLDKLVSEFGPEVIPYLYGALDGTVAGARRHCPEALPPAERFRTVRKAAAIAYRTHVEGDLVEDAVDRFRESLGVVAHES